VKLHLYIGMLIGVYGLREGKRGIEDLWRDTRLRRQEPTPIAQAQPGFVLLRGRVLALSGTQRMLDAPLSGARCVAFSAYLRSGPSWSDAVPFLLADDSGRARVDPGAVTLLRPDWEAPRGDCERVLRPDDEVFLFGVATREPDAAGQGGDYREPPTSLIVRSSRRYGLVIATAERPSLRRQAALRMCKGAFALAAAVGMAVGW
jgi:hypothetical protein